MSIIMVKVPDATYGVSVRPGLVRGAGEVVRELSERSRIAVVTDEHVAAWYLEPLTRSLTEHRFEVIPLVLSAGEESKSIDSVNRIYDTLLSARIERSTPLIALGGGVVGDTAGFAAATLLRGLPLIQMPTTLLAMVDSSVGGKTGVNHKAGKNLIGAFHQPIAVLADVDTLRTLPPRELRAGLAECIKHEVIADGDGFNRLERSLDQVLALDGDCLARLVAHNVLIKTTIVEADPFEHGIRAHLNFGHTFGHAIEKVCNYAILHGECVSLGIVAACNLAVSLGMFPRRELCRVVDLLVRAGLPVSGLTLQTDDLLDAMRSDKKVTNARLRFVLPDRIGHVVIREDIPDHAVRDAIDSIR